MIGNDSNIMVSLHCRCCHVSQILVG